MNFKNQTENQQFIKALIEGKTIQHRIKGENWYDFDLNWCLENEDPFGPWNCADCYEWRVKPKTQVITVEITVTKTLTIEGVKDCHYKAGEQLFFIQKHEDGYKKHKHVAMYDHAREFKSAIFFETEEAMNKAYEQIINAQKGL